MARQRDHYNMVPTTRKTTNNGKKGEWKKTKSIFIFALFFLVILIPFLPLITSTSAQLPSQSLILTEMDISLNIHVNLTAVQISLTLIPTSAQENTFKFTLKGKINDTNVQIRDGEPLLFNQTYNQTHTSFIIYFPKSLLTPGANIYVDISYVVDTLINNEHQVMDFSIHPESTPTTSRVIAWIDPSLSITVLSPQPLNQDVMGKITRITWIFLQEKEISVYIDTLYNPNNKFTTIEISPQTILIKGIEGSLVSFNVNLTSNYPLPQIVSIITTENSTQIESPVTLNPYQSVLIKVTVKLPEKDTTAQIIFLSKIPNSQPVILTMLLLPEPASSALFSKAQIITIMIIAVITFIVAFIVFKPPVFVRKIYNQIVRYKPFSLFLSPIQIKQCFRTSKTVEQNKVTDVNNIALTLAKTNYFDKNEKMLLAYLLENKGISQQKIADALSLSKATVSRTISKLQAKQLVIKEQSGMTNKIFLNEEKFYSTLENISKDMDETPPKNQI